jgi:hypothetical protein
MKKRVFKRPEDGLLTELISALVEVRNETDCCVFFEYSGHVNSIHLQITKSKRRYLNVVLERDMYLDNPKSAENLRECIAAIKNRKF